MTNHLSPQRVLRPDLRGLLASTGFEGQPVKGTYFFAGERRNDNAWKYTTHPLDARDEQWNSDVSTRGWVMDRMVSAHVNTVVMSYWSNMPTFSPMDIQSTTLSGVLDAVQERPLVVMPAIESGYTPGLPSWEFSNDFPSPGGFEFAPGLVRRIGWLVELFSGRMSSWATIYDRDGYPRHARTVNDQAEFGQAQPCYSTDQSARRNAKREVVTPSTYAVECGSRPLRSVSVRQPIDPVGPG